MSYPDLVEHLLRARGLLLPLLLAHVLCDFALGGPWHAEPRARTVAFGAAVRHLALFALLAAALLLPLVPLRTACLAAAAATAAHAAGDGAGLFLGRRRNGRFRHLVLEQALHLLLLAAVATAGEALLPDLLRDGSLRVERTMALLLGYAACWWFGAAVVRELLASLPSASGAADEGSAERGQGADSAGHGRPGAGRVIGILERLLVLSLVLAGAWGSAGLVVGAKSIARYKRIEQEPAFAEAYLVGTLASMLIAVGTGLALRALFA